MRVDFELCCVFQAVDALIQQNQASISLKYRQRDVRIPYELFFCTTGKDLTLQLTLGFMRAKQAQGLCLLHPGQ